MLFLSQNEGWEREGDGFGVDREEVGEGGKREGQKRGYMYSVSVGGFMLLIIK